MTVRVTDEERAELLLAAKAAGNERRHFSAIEIARRIELPTWHAYQMASPSEKKSILSQWQTVAAAPLTYDNTAGMDRHDRENAVYNLHRAEFGAPLDEAPEPRGFIEERNHSGTMQPHEWGE